MSELRIKSDYSLIWYGDLKHYFEEIAGRMWNVTRAEDFPAQNTMVDVEIPDMEYEAIDPSHEWFAEEGFSFERWFAGGEFYNEPYEENLDPRIGYVLQWLYEQGHIPAGKYIVEISW